MNIMHEEMLKINKNINMEKAKSIIIAAENKNNSININGQQIKRSHIF